VCQPLADFGFALADKILFFSVEQDPVHQLVLRALRGSEVVVANSATIPKAGVPNFDSSACEAFERVVIVKARRQFARYGDRAAFWASDFASIEFVQRSGVGATTIRATPLRRRGNRVLRPSRVPEAPFCKPRSRKGNSASLWQTYRVQAPKEQEMPPYQSWQPSRLKTGIKNRPVGKKIFVR